MMYESKQLQYPIFKKRWREQLIYNELKIINARITDNFESPTRWLNLVISDKINFIVVDDRKSKIGG